LYSILGAKTNWRFRILGKEKFLIIEEILMTENPTNFVFSDCEECGKELNDMEKKFCHDKCAETNQLHAICSSCLDREYDGKWPAITPR